MAENEEELEEAIDTLEEIGDDEQKIRIAELRHKYILDRNSEIETATEKGLKKGREQGLQEGRKEGIQEATKITVIRMLKEKIEISMIEKITKLTRTEIEKIRQEYNIK